MDFWQSGQEGLAFGSRSPRLRAQALKGGKCKVQQFLFDTVEVWLLWRRAESILGGNSPDRLRA